MTQGNCLTCKHRPYGDHRLHVDCMIFESFWSKRKPKPKNNGVACKRYEPDSSTTSGTSKGERESKSGLNRDPIEGTRIKITPDLVSKAVAIQKQED